MEAAVMESPQPHHGAEPRRPLGFELGDQPSRREAALLVGTGQDDRGIQRRYEGIAIVLVEIETRRLELGRRVQDVRDGRSLETLESGDR